MQLTRPRIGITTSSGTLPEAHAYVRAVERAGGAPVAMPNDSARIDDALARVDGVLLGGGVDVDPARYGGNPDHGRCERDGYRPERDAFELALVPALRDRDVPTLAICRGLQVVNVACGGTLIEDLRDALGARYALEHRQTDDAGVDRADYADGHVVAVVPGSAFARLVGSHALATNSMHHQAVSRVGTGLVVAGRTSDDVVEVLDATFAHRFFFAVQWHPEELDDAASAALFGGLVAAARAR